MSIIPTIKDLEKDLDKEDPTLRVIEK